MVDRSSADRSCRGQSQAAARLYSADARLRRAADLAGGSLCLSLRDAALCFRIPDHLSVDRLSRARAGSSSLLGSLLGASSGGATVDMSRVLSSYLISDTHTREDRQGARRARALQQPADRLVGSAVAEGFQRRFSDLFQSPGVDRRHVGRLCRGRCRGLRPEIRHGHGQGDGRRLRRDGGKLDGAGPPGRGSRRRTGTQEDAGPPDQNHPRHHQFSQRACRFQPDHDGHPARHCRRRSRNADWLRPAPR